MEESAQAVTGDRLGKNIPMGEENIHDSESKFKKIFPKLYLGLKCVNCGVLVVAFTVHLHNLFSATWATDHGVDTATGHQGRIHHQLFGFTEEGNQDVYPLHREGYWQDWKKPLIKLEIIALSLGFTAIFVHGIIIFLHFLHPRKAEAMALLTSVVLLSCGGGGLLVKTSLDYSSTRPVYGFRDTTVPSTFVTDITEETGGMEAVIAGAMYFIAGVIDVMLILITSSNLPINPDVTTPTKTHDVTTLTKTPDVTTLTKTPDVTTPTKTPDVTTITKTPDVTTLTKTPVAIRSLEKEGPSLAN
ncbi:uncharacterized protein LOC117316415 [Pecten maximus]|uniref:uncharacterized protein LOC117316415 n=1 Tax=Pecten maximus TaxID=6579 RepID=UPI0014591759|nr:uncharacterized protein LOC117316415 [Pecten maximus]